MEHFFQQIIEEVDVSNGSGNIIFDTGIQDNNCARFYRCIKN